MTQAIAKKENPTWVDYVNEVMPQFNQIAEREKLVLWKAESQFALQAISKNTALAKCNVNSVQNAIINVAAVGLTLNPADAYAYLVPRSNECTLVISFKGLIKVATDAGGIEWVQAKVVKENDEFTAMGVSQPPEHKITTPFNEELRGKSIGVYCVAKTVEGDYLTELMSAEEIAKIRECAMTKNVWDKWPDEMAKKAVIKRASKQWPRTDKSSRLHKAVEVINEVEGFDPDYNIYTDEQKKHFDYLIENDDSYGYYLFIQSVGQDIETALFNSFEDGNKNKGDKEFWKGKLNKTTGKDKCRKLMASGYEILEQLCDQATEHCNNEDAFGLAETIEDLQPEGKAIWWHKIDKDIQEKATELMATIHTEDDGEHN